VTQEAQGGAGETPRGMLAAALGLSEGTAVVVIDASGVHRHDEAQFALSLNRSILDHLGGRIQGALALSGRRQALVLSPEHGVDLDSAIDRLHTLVPRFARGRVTLAVYHLPEDDAAVRRLVAHLPERRLQALRDQGDVSGEARDLAKVIAGADLAPLMRVEPVYALIPGRPPRSAYDRLQLSLNDLERALRRRLYDAPSVYDQLLETVDHRLLSHVAREPRAEERYVAVSLSTDTVLNTQFPTWAAEVPASLRGDLIVNLPFFEMSVSTRDFSRAVKRLRTQGFGVGIDGVPVSQCHRLPAMRHWASMVTVLWEPGGDIPLERIQRQLRRLVGDIGGLRVTLAGVEEDSALDVGREAGVELFQGPVVEQRVHDSETASATSPNEPITAAVPPWPRTRARGGHAGAESPSPPPWDPKRQRRWPHLRAWLLLSALWLGVAGAGGVATHEDRVDRAQVRLNNALAECDARHPFDAEARGDCRLLHQRIYRNDIARLYATEATVVLGPPLIGLAVLRGIGAARRRQRPPH
jgi:hypothetical protein